MLTLRPAICALMMATVLTACGDAGGGSGESLKPDTTTTPDARLFGSCRADDPALKKAAVIVEVDLDGSGASNEVALVRRDATGPCANALFTTFDGEPAAVSLGGLTLDLEPRSTRVVSLNGTDRELLLVREQPQLRGGFHAHLFGYSPEGLAEVESSGNPLLEFVATDGGGLPVTATCKEHGGLSVVSARPHAPTRGGLTWDVQETTYSLDGTEAVKESVQQTADAVPDAQLRKQMPQLFDLDGYFADCAD